MEEDRGPHGIPKTEYILNSLNTASSQAFMRKVSSEELTSFLEAFVTTASALPQDVRHLLRGELSAAGKAGRVRQSFGEDPEHNARCQVLRVHATSDPSEERFITIVYRDGCVPGFKIWLDDSDLDDTQVDLLSSLGWDLDEEAGTWRRQ